MITTDQESFIEIVHKFLNILSGYISRELLILPNRGPLLCFSELRLWTLKQLKHSVIPRISVITADSLENGIFVNPTLPEDAAEFLRNIRE